MRLRRRYADFYAARGKTGGRQPLHTPSDFDASERQKIERLSYKVGEPGVKVLDPHDREVGHYAIYGWWRLPADQAVNEWGDFVLDTEMCETYGVAFVVQRGRWFTRDEWHARYPDYELGRVALHGPSLPSLDSL